MLAWLTATLLAQTLTPAEMPPQSVEKIVGQQVRPLPGQLDSVPVLNSNSPELVGEPGILLSTFPPEGMAVPEAHLNFPLEGRFDVFAHHVYKVEASEALDSLYLGVLIHNPSAEPVTVRVLTGASYLSQPDAPFIQLPDFVAFGPRNPVFAGPGSRVMGDILQGRRQEIFPAVLTVAPGKSELLLNQPIPVRELEPPINGRSTLVQLESSGPVYVASLAQMATTDLAGNEAPPDLASWQSLLRGGGLAGPRDRIPTPLPITNGEQLIYGRVAGVSEGSQWQATLTDSGNAEITADPRLTIPAAGEAFSYGVSLLYGGTMGTDQVQSAPMLVRYLDTAYQAHGNYGVRYSLTLPLYNPADTAQTVSVALQTALKEDQLSQDGLRFLEPPAAQTFFRGPVQVRYRSDSGLPQVGNIHLVQRRGQQAEPLATVMIAPLSTRTVSIDLLYPPDATPPQVLTVKTAALPGEASPR
ncbi:DUF3370 domain-containing protein [Leptolyngbya sp. BC1307]|uniref:DUF3370 domain-containing protein n=1 Tax=Leptolyngbya sp. BC1307 TaxID=2029589 RepID=UPI000EFCDFCC|nr:DUF3370 domain-containing protein [Leptolyngbya sp. BC1307]